MAEDGIKLLVQPFGIAAIWSRVASAWIRCLPVMLCVLNACQLVPVLD